MKPIILAATDLGEWGDEAIREADRWARELDGAELAVMHCVPIHGALSPLLPDLAAMRQGELGDLEQEAGRALNERVATLTGRSVGEFRALITSGTAHAEIVRTAEELKAGIIVVGARGASGLMRVLVGHTAEKITRYAHCPVLVVRPGPRTGHILVATDLSKAAAAAVTRADALAKVRGAKLTALHVVDTSMPFPLDLGIGMVSAMTPEIATAASNPATAELIIRRGREQLMANLESLGVKAEPTVVDGWVVDALARKARALPADLVVIGTVGRTGLARVTLGNTAEAAIRELPCSVLVVRGDA